MGPKDLIVTPLLLLIVMLLAYLIRPYVTNLDTRRFFFPALTLKVAGAISLGLIYSFYYEGGDTFGYTTFGSHYIWEAFLESPFLATKLIFGNNVFSPETYKFAIKMWYFDDAPSYFVVRVAGFFSILTFDTYSSIAVCFALVGFSGLWALFIAFVRHYPRLVWHFALAIFFIPSVVFWGSGVMKDTLTISALGWAVFAALQLSRHRKGFVQNLFILILALWVIFTVKIYIMLALIPAIAVWLYSMYQHRIRQTALKLIGTPLLIVGIIGTSYYTAQRITADSDRYSFASIMKTAEITAKDNSMWTVRAEGSGYSLGDYDFSVAGLTNKFVPAVWLAFFRPYLWEINSPLMLLAAVENVILLAATIYFVLSAGPWRFLKTTFKDPNVLFCFTFAVAFAFAIGVSSGNFGSLVRYKIPIIPLYVIGLVITWSRCMAQRRNRAKSENLSTTPELGMQ